MARQEKATAKIYEVTIVGINGHTLNLIVDGQSHAINVACESPLLAKATPVQREIIEVSPSGYGLHWPLLDEDLAIDGLIRRAHLRPELHTTPSQGAG